MLNLPEIQLILNFTFCEGLCFGFVVEGPEPLDFPIG